MEDKYEEISQKVEQNGQATDHRKIHKIRGSAQKVQQPSNSIYR